MLSRRGFVTSQPQKRPRSSFVRFEADQPNERWQADITHWALQDGTDAEILNVIDDHSRLLVGSEVRAVFKAADVVACFHQAAATWDFPASLLTDNGAVFAAGPRGGGRCAIELECDRLGIKMVHSTPYHPQICGKVERFHQSLKRYLAKQERAATCVELQRQLDRFAAYSNEVRPHRALARRTPAEAYVARPKAVPRGPTVPVHCRVRHDRIDRGGGITLRHDSVLRHIKVGARHAGTRVVMLVAGLHVRVVSEDGELLRELTIDPKRVYQPMGGRWNDVPGHV